MSLEEKIAFCSGASFWETKGVDRFDIPSLFLADGPHGLRKQEGKRVNNGLNASAASTCFPTASALASTWDIELIRKMGIALGKEAKLMGVDIVLGPGVNVKRNPLCGRNFEYFSEDPWLSGKIASAWVRGVQSAGAGTALKHFALNNQELKRMTTDVSVDERALREYYLPAFEVVVKEANPASVMCAYNKVEGVYCSNNKHLIRDILRGEWGFEGVVMTDWGAMHDRVTAFIAGTDLEMPWSAGIFDDEAMAAVRSGALPESFIDESVDRLLKLAERAASCRGGVYVENSLEYLHAEHHALARKIASSAAVLLKNDSSLLPLNKDINIAVIGRLAENPHIQGMGSSVVTPTKRLNFLKALTGLGVKATYSPGYGIKGVRNDELIKEAVAAATVADAAIICVGLPDVFECETVDRPHMRLPEDQIALIKAVSSANPESLVLLTAGSSVETPWDTDVKALMLTHLAGQGGSEAIAGLIFGDENPGGKLSESFPVKYEDVPSSGYYGVNPKEAPYLESMYCGYRYFCSSDVKVKYPFGFGLSYTEFEYRSLNIEKQGKNAARVSVIIRNIGDMDGCEVAQLYVSANTGGRYRPKKELKGFAKAFLNAGREKEVTFDLDERSFAIFDPKSSKWVVERGEYALEIGASCIDIKLSGVLYMDGEEPVPSSCCSWYIKPDGAPSRQDFLSIHPSWPASKIQSKGSYDLSSSLKEMAETSLLCRLLCRILAWKAGKDAGRGIDESDAEFVMLFESATDNPVSTWPLFQAGRISMAMARIVPRIANGFLPVNNHRHSPQGP